MSIKSELKKRLEEKKIETRLRHGSIKKAFGSNLVKAAKKTYAGSKKTASYLRDTYETGKKEKRDWDRIFYGKTTKKKKHHKKRKSQNFVIKGGIAYPIAGSNQNKKTRRGKRNRRRNENSPFYL